MRARSDAARQLRRLKLHWQKRSATAVTPSHKCRRGAEAPGQQTAARRLHWVVRRPVVRARRGTIYGLRHAGNRTVPAAAVNGGAKRRFSSRIPSAPRAMPRASETGATVEVSSDACRRMTLILVVDSR
jgi:hypothetical protein